MAYAASYRKYCHSTNSEVNTPEQTLLSRLIILYNEASSWYTRQQILSVFVCDYSKTELLTYLPGLSKWRIDEARKSSIGRTGYSGFLGGNLIKVGGIN